MTPNDLSKLKPIKLLILDVDGVLTDGRIVYSDNGEEIKTFDVKDGLGIRLLLDMGIHVSIITGRHSKALHYRCKDLGISSIFEGISDKTAVLNTLIKQTDLTPEQMAAIGDDLPDIPLMNAIGCAIAVADAHEMVRNHADMVTLAKGGNGAVREVSEAILKAQGYWNVILEKWSSTKNRL